MHPEILTDVQKGALKQVGPLAKARGFYLAGGTSLAIQLGHRPSQDFDWFTQDKIDRPEELALFLREEGIRTEKEAISPNTLQLICEGVETSFFSYPPELVEELIHWKDYDVLLASIADICCMKLVAVSGRGSKKDFIDIYAIGKESGIRIADMLDLYETRYRTRETASVLYGLAYFEDAETEPTPKLTSRITWTQVKNTIVRWLDEYYSR